jgi:hypothetical protein
MATFTFFIKPETPYRGAVKLESPTATNPYAPGSARSASDFFDREAGRDSIEAQIRLKEHT